MDGSEFATRVLSELKSYAPTVIPTLFIYIIESASPLKASYFELEPSADGSGVADTTAVDKAVKKAGSRLANGNLLFTLILFLIAAVGQFMKIDRGDAVGIDFDEPILNYTNWYDAYYAITLFRPVVFLNARALNMLCGMTSRIVFRNAEGVIGRSKIKLGYRFFVTALSILTAVGTVWTRNSICVAIFYASMVHFLVSSIVVSKVVKMKQQIIAALFFLLFSAMLFGLKFVLGADGGPQQMLDTPSSEADWLALIFSALWSASPFFLISLSYRLDHSLAHPDELLVGPPSVDGMIAGAGAAASASSAATFAEPFAKPYFHAALGGWLSAHALLAVLYSTDHFTYVPELMGMYLVYVSLPLIVLAVLVTAMVRGELRRVFAYKEEWVRKAC
ncbi:hypothetical protein EW145_g7171 [Phellinidium pouzarii]|uniref:Uncharacterized protein n=1 Tax=Phellinidium pouzarii TaxID=167371 RepID=A0A4S4KP17_9AGAM|nr:hypothetical protein EW145_g7171 [Phellinidium pouzarii]